MCVCVCVCTNLLFEKRFNDKNERYTKQMLIGCYAECDQGRSKALEPEGEGGVVGQHPRKIKISGFLKI